MPVISRARELTGDGYPAETVVRMLYEQMDVVVHRSSVRRWATRRGERAAAADNLRRAAVKARKNGARGIGNPRSGPEFKLARMRALRDVARLKDEQIARVMEFDYDDPITCDMVRYALKTGRYPRSLT